MTLDAASSYPIDQIDPVQHVLLNGSLAINDEFIPAQCHCDIGANGNAFIDLAFAQKNNIELTPLKHDIPLSTFDGSPAVSGPITHCCVLPFRGGAGAHLWTTFYVTSLPN